MHNRKLFLAVISLTAVAALLAVTWTRVRSQQPQHPPAVQQSGLLQSAHKPKVLVSEFKIIAKPGDKIFTADELNKSMKVRRDHAWDIVGRIWQPVDVQGGKIPLWMTWYEQEDIEQLYKEMVGKDMQAKPATRADIRANVAALLQQHNTKDLQASLSHSRVGKTLRQFTLPQFHNLGPNRKPGTGAIYYSPAYVKHLLESAAAIANCNPGAPPRPADHNNLYAQCMDSEMPPDAIMIKTSWAQFNEQFPYIITGSPEILTGLQATPTGKWISYFAQPTISCCNENQFTIKDEDGTTWGLLGMHIASKELRTWTWTSVFFQNSGWDWAADQPPTLTPTLGSYGMCTVTDFAEGDPAPWAAYDGKGKAFQTLAKAIKDVSGFMNGAQWCANPFIEPDMSRGNCVGCHQGSPNSVLPLSITKDRQSNPSDFSFSFDTNQANIIQIRKAYALKELLRPKSKPE